MKTIYLLIPTILFVYSCSSDKNNESETPVDSQVVQEDALIEEIEFVEIDSTGVIPNTDWEKDNLNGIIKSTSIHSETLDEDGEPYGMGGSSESKEFTRKGLLLSEESSGCCGAAFTEIEYKYNEKNQLTHRIIKQTDDWDEDFSEIEMTEKEKYFYNEEGVLVKKKIAGPDKILAKEHTYKFNASGKMIQEVIEDVKNGDVYATDYIYENSKLTMKTSGASSYKRVFGLNDQGDKITEELHLSSGSIQEIKYTYEYDEMGNWIKRTSKSRYVYENEENEDWKNYLRETRKIVYY